jgi:hypothetical protein
MKRGIAMRQQAKQFLKLIMLFIAGMGQAHAEWLLNQKPLNLDQKIWSYSAPGTMKNSQLFPTRGNDGLLIKYGNDNQKRLTYLIRTTSLTNTPKNDCEKNARIMKGRVVSATANECTWTQKKKNDQVLIQWIYQDVKSLKLVSFTITSNSKHMPEITEDLKQLKKVLL